MAHQIVIEFPQSSPSEANRRAAELQTFVRRLADARGIGSSITCNLHKQDETYQDFGTSLAIIFGTPAAIAIAKGIHDFIAARGHYVSIKTDRGEIVATGSAASNIDIDNTVRALVGIPKIDS